MVPTRSVPRSAGLGSLGDMVRAIHSITTRRRSKQLRERRRQCELSLYTSNSIVGQSSTSMTDSDAFAFNPPNARPLSDVTVVALEQVISMPLATRHLADLGARVIKIERPSIGDFVRHHDKRVRGKLCSHFVWINRNKESLALDIKQAEDMEILKKVVVEKADVFVQNLRPGDAEKMGLGYESIKQIMNDAYPGQQRGDKLIYCSVSGYGAGGPRAHSKAYDLLIQAEAGLLSITGTEEEMAKVGCSIADVSDCQN
jgi:itaconate CoA-transferase